MSENIIELKNIKKCFDDTVVVEDFNLTVRKGEFVTFLGPSGCGKTTTLRMIAGFEFPTEGQILLNGKDISHIPPNLRPINTVFQRYALFPHLNVYDNVAFGLNLKRLPKQEVGEKVRRVLEVVDLEGFEKRKISTLSGGQQQRIAIARAIVNEPDILLLDEPLGALDLKMRKEMQLELKSMHERLGITFIYVTHDQEEALTMSDKVVVMSDGMIQQTGTPEEIYNEPKNAFVADFIGESNIFEGRMAASMTVEFCGTKFPCVDNVPRDTRVDVVVRPEDVQVTAPEDGQLRGIVDSAVFKGMYYEITALCGDNEVVIQSTKSARTGSEIGMRIDPDGIHVMPAGVLVNVFDGFITKEGRAAFAGGEYECDLTQLYPDSRMSGEASVITAQGEEISLSGLEVTVEVPVKAVSMSDEEREYRASGNIISFIYKGSHYNYTVRTATEEDFVLDEDDLWNEGDHVSLMIPGDQIILKRKQG
ncbi:ABC transporter ATP-binding protein [Ruminococcus sp. CLA-AA-H200]|uniref:Spermidine/putrescine import ATP-binding protein PotA n=1 Tax=Ruminococcus turbiniformis TaxID=2881258 RepID=A0ABS8G222_9FIRM|nr:ABC transporter ATP-binding protein [Ruminococcus turbiniformis]MCC2256216.1 ABC transporter ATP-binding protein [Ruminococcus turbiniformis]